MSNVYVKSEFAPLKRVVMAQSEFACLKVGIKYM